MKKNYPQNRNNIQEKSIICSCGAVVKLTTHKNYPFGMKSKARILRRYKCNKCGKIVILDKMPKGRRR